MTVRRLPKAQIPVHGGAHTAASPKALERWRPEMRAAQTITAGADNVILMTDVIGTDFFTGEGVTAARVAAELKRIGTRDVVVILNSPGGDYEVGLEIYNMLVMHPARVTVLIVGLAASAAASIAMAGDEIKIARAGFLMIHNVWVSAVGDRNDLRQVADWLEPFDQVFVDLFSARSGVAPAEVAGMLDRETYIGGQEAVAKGFADALLSSDDVVEVDALAAKALRAERIIETSLKAQGVSSREGKSLVAQMKGGARDAALSAARDAGDLTAELVQLVRKAKAIRVI